MNKNYILGLFQGDGSFTIRINKKYSKYLWLSPLFNISLHKNNENVIKDIKNYFGVGHYRIDNKNICRYEVNRLEDIINVIIPFFLANRLKGHKHISFLMFKIIVTKLYNKEHYVNLNDNRNNNGLRFSPILLNLINMAYHMNPINHNTTSREEFLNYLNPNESKIVQSDLIYQDLLNIELKNYPSDNNIDIAYIQGLFDADGSLTIYFEYNTQKRLRIRMTFNITQDVYNKVVVDLLQNYFDCGRIYKVGNTYKYDVKNVSDLEFKVFPKFDIDWIKNNNTVRLNKLISADYIFKWLSRNGSSTIKTMEDYTYLLPHMYNIRKQGNQTLEEYVEEHIKNKPIEK